MREVISVSRLARPLGTLDFPPVMFGSSNLGNLFVTATDDEKLTVCKSWFDNVPRPVFIDTAGKYGAGMALEVIGRSLRELGIGPDDVVINNKLGWARKPMIGVEPTFEPGAWVDLTHDAEQRISYEGILQCWEEGNDLLGSPYRAKMLSVHDPDEYLAAASSADDRKRRLDDVLGAYRALRELVQRGEADSVGVGAKDWRSIVELEELVDLDWVMFGNSFTIYRHEPELLEFMSSLKERGIAIINSAVFHAGFLLGGPYFDYRRVDADDPQDKPMVDWRDQFLATCTRFDVEPVAACMRFANSPPAVVALAVNSSRPDRVAQLVESASADVPGEFWEAMREQHLIRPDYPFV